MCAELRHCHRWVTNRQRQRVSQWRTRDGKTSLSVCRRSPWPHHSSHQCQVTQGIFQIWNITWGDVNQPLGVPSLPSPLPFPPSPLSLLSPPEAGGCCAKLGGTNPPPPEGVWETPWDYPRPCIQPFFKNHAQLNSMHRYGNFSAFYHRMIKKLIYRAHFTPISFNSQQPFTVVSDQ